MPSLLIYKFRNDFFTVTTQWLGRIEEKRKIRSVFPAT